PFGLRRHLCSLEALYGISHFVPRLRDDAYASPQPERTLDIDHILLIYLLSRCKHVCGPEQLILNGFELKASSGIEF
ncbi:hypothetical protein SDB51_08480, partial [Legionella pneumophila serogroup 1]